MVGCSWGWCLELIVQGRRRERQGGRIRGNQELKGEGMGASLCNDVVGAKIFFRKLLRRTSGAEMFSFDEYLITDLEI